MRSVYSYPYLVVILAAVLCNLRIGIWLGGWTMPVLAGFQVSGSELNTANAHVIDQWLYLLMEISLCWSSVASTWESAKYLFMLNLQTNTFLSGALPSAG
jgi:ABC-2 type transport system permease protein